LKKITNKDKKDWQNFTSSKDKIEDKDNYNIQFKEKEFLKSIDLHGYTLEQANKKISNFIEKCYDEGVSKINIITGKGSRSKNKEDPFKSYDLSILKYSVPNFIKSNSELMKKIKIIDFDSVNSSLKGSFDIILKKKL
jgi:DNA-nicking Smr family endonuclease